MGEMSDAERLREGARIMRSVVDDNAWAIPLVAGALEDDADRLDRGEPVDDLAEGLALADSFIDPANRRPPTDDPDAATARAESEASDG